MASPTPVRRACDGCKIRKVKCSNAEISISIQLGVIPISSSPCQQCVGAGIDCTYLRVPGKTGPRRPRMRTIEAIERQKAMYGAPYERPPAMRSPILARSPVHSLLNPPDSPSMPIRDASSVSSDDTGSASASCFGPQRQDEWVALSSLKTYIQIYRHRTYPIWPIISASDLEAALAISPRDPELYCLATALCAATIAQLQLATSGTATGDLLIKECLRVRQTFDYPKEATEPGALTSFFLHVYYASESGWTHKSITYLREAITFTQLLELHKESTYAAYSDPRDRRRLRRLFWLLYVTERGPSMHGNLPAVLAPTISLPSTNDPDVDDPTVLTGFVSLVHLFASLDTSFFHPHDETAPNPNLSRTWLTDLGKRLSRPLPITTDSSETQRADILITQQWMRTLAWQMGLKQGCCGPSAKAGAEPEAGVTLTLPKEIAVDVLKVTSKLSFDAIRAHGPGMELKLFEVTNALADVIMCTPSPPSPANALTQSGKADSREVFGALCRLLSKLPVHNTCIGDLLKGKAARIFDVDGIPGSLNHAIPLFEEVGEDHEDDQRRRSWSTS
ncbi:hypothetical protein SAICODRAFT_28996 [Saitoella complicata NRRL Y-17804]|uniref:Zn(2)-C6 fungal-type domain-containing protein n=1 Tax=Saitoella complicata (strain BCRC 22490 / CBS 7301 / JCM 7358 / NBRC 10748 / NRRL Y-17804) TaxID=698492 RepID=A0A0E9NBW0_SAICN|nr:uncharacterized protein SAICODRAFT_28996 [Saitoella complicata NRRL Y-17804]ODQ55364.1 hypothetical protein SAICODRAFT_28996 [Saitoella complicata NRRL Y-17804]GAO47196.1 hypothetical protein G7K_1406-t1 [Saitoella complicata NRRL Y-17804]